jgi:hypothetical protein
MKQEIKLILFIGLTLFLSKIVIAQTDTICKSQTTITHVLPKVVVTNDALRVAMDSCISMSRKCQFYLDGIEPEIIVRQVFGSNEFVIKLCFVITTREENNISYLVDLYNRTDRITTVSCRYKDVLFIYCTDNKDTDLFVNTNLLDTIIYKEPVRSYKYTHIEDVDKVNSKSSDVIKGYVFLHLDHNGKWWLNTLNCVQVDEDQILIENEYEKIYYVPSDKTDNNLSKFHLIE